MLDYLLDLAVSSSLVIPFTIERSPRLFLFMLNNEF
jgi:hypothetical protein